MTVAALAALAICARAGRTQTRPSAPILRVDYFGTERGYTVGREPIWFLCVVRNVGAVPLSTGSVRLRIYPVKGMSYTQGDTEPLLPALPPGQSAAFKWRMAADSDTGPVIAALIFERSAPPPLQERPHGGPSRPDDLPAAADTPEMPTAVLDVVPRLCARPELDLPAGALPTATASKTLARVGGNLVAVEALPSENSVPILLFGEREGGYWRTLATASPIVQTLSCEPGQEPWWQTFRWSGASAEKTADSGSMTISGGIGPQWTAEVSLTAARDSHSIGGRIKITARRNMVLYGLQLPRLLAPSVPEMAGGSDANGRAGAAAIEFKTGPLLLEWTPTELSGWTDARLPDSESNAVRVAGVRLSAPLAGTPLARGESAIFHFRIVAPAGLPAREAGR